MNLIVGGTGFVGGHLAEYLFQKGEISKGTFRKGSHLQILDQCGVQCIEADLTDRRALHELLEAVDVVYNLASPTPRNGDMNYSEVNTLGLRNLLEESEEHGVKSLVQLSTIDVFGFGEGGTVSQSTQAAPTHPYQKAKLEAEKLAEQFSRKNGGMNVMVVRAARAIGSRDTTLVVPMLRMIADGKVVLPRGTGAEMSFTHPKDIAQAMLAMAGAGHNGDVVLVKSFDARAEDVAAAIANASGKQATLKTQGLFGKAAIPAYTGSQLRAALRVDVQESWRSIGYAPAYGLGDTAKEIAGWYAKQPWVTEEGLA